MLYDAYNTYKYIVYCSNKYIYIIRIYPSFNLFCIPC